MGRPHLMLTPTALGTRLLLREEGETLLRARLPSPLVHPSHLRAAPMLCEALARWLGQPLCIVLSAEEPDGLSGLGLCDDFGFGVRTLHYEVEVVRVRARRHREASSPRDRRQLDLGGVK